jgi:glycogen(starch) synthase
MKVFMTADAVGGVWTYALELCTALAIHDTQVMLATMGARPEPSQRAAAARIENVQLIESDYALEWMQNPWRDVDRAGQWLLEKAQAFDADVIHLNGYAHASLPWTRPVLSVAHSCVTTWWQAVYGTQPPDEWFEYQRRVKHGLVHADRIVAPTRAFAESIAAAYQLQRSIDVIHNGIGKCETKPAIAQPLILASGRAWDEAKNVATLDRVAAQLKWPVYLAGSTQGPDGRSWSAQSIQCLGSLSQDELSSWLARAHIFVHPALYEPFGLAPLEAARAGCALVLADLPGLRELWEGAAEFFDPREPSSLHEALAGLIEQPDKRADLALAARTRAARFTSAGMAASYAKLYREMVDSHRNVHKAVA